MIMVILGTQDKPFERLLNAVQKQIDLGNIKEKVIVQAGITRYNSNEMEIFDLLPTEKYEDIVGKADIVITHGGVGSIIDSLKRNKKVIAAARLKKYGEHVNDHQKQIIDRFVDMNYILKLDDFDRLDEVLNKVGKFKMKKYKSTTNKVIDLIDNFIEKI